MERLQRIRYQFSTNNPTVINVRQQLWKNRHRIIYAMQPHITEIAKRLIKHQYRQILRKIQQTRDQLDSRSKIAKLVKNQNGMLVDNQQFLHSFKNTLQNNLYQILPSILNQLADKLTQKMKKTGETGILSQSLSMYSSFMGSYQCKLSILQRLTPNVRTLHYLQNQIMQFSNERQSSSSIWILLYIFSAAFVQMFGKYITKPQMGIILMIVKEAFVLNLIVLVTRGQKFMSGGWGEIKGGKVSGLVQEWIKQLNSDLH